MSVGLGFQGGSGVPLGKGMSKRPEEERKEEVLEERGWDLEISSQRGGRDFWAF